jgi:hypothetical protein
LTSAFFLTAGFQDPSLATEGPHCNLILNPPLFGIGHNSAERYEIQRIDLYKTILEKWGGPEETATKSYGKYGLDLYHQLLAIDPSYGELVIDPGLMLHLDEFKSFVKKSPRKLPAWEMRQAFREDLGTEIVYRGLALTDAELEEILFKGLAPQKMYSNEDLLLDNQNAAEARRKAGCGACGFTAQSPEIILKYKQNGILQLFRSRVTLGGDSFVTQSFTGHRELAIGMAHAAIHQRNRVAGLLKSPFFDKSNPLGLRAYVFEVQVPKLDLIFFKYPEFEGAWQPGRSGNYFMAARKYKKDWRGGVESDDMAIFEARDDKDLESFMLYGVETKNIVSISEVVPHEIGDYVLVVNGGSRAPRKIYSDWKTWLKDHFPLKTIYTRP